MSTPRRDRVGSSASKRYQASAKGSRVPKQTEKELNMKGRAWHCASALFATVPWGHSIEDVLVIEERIYLIQENDSEDIWEKAYHLAEEETNESEFDYDGQVSCERFLGIRKIIELKAHTNPRYGADVPGDGCEVSFSFFKLKSKQDLEKLKESDAVDVTYQAEATRV